MRSVAIVLAGARSVASCISRVVGAGAYTSAAPQKVPLPPSPVRLFVVAVGVLAAPARTSPLVCGCSAHKTASNTCIRFYAKLRLNVNSLLYGRLNLLIKLFFAPRPPPLLLPPLLFPSFHLKFCGLKFPKPF